MPKEELGFAVITSFTKVFAGVLGFFFALFIVMVVLGMFASLGEESSPDALQLTTIYGADDANAKIASIVVDGILLGERTTDDIWTALAEDSVTYGYEVKSQLSRLAQRDDIAAVMLELHSPGGTIFGTQAIVDGVTQYQQATGKPVYAFVGSMAASGGYWAAVSADQIFADAGTAIGSIGVLTGPFKFYDGVISEDGGLFLGGVETKDGIATTYITAGKYKDLGNPYRQLSDEEIAVLQQSVDNAYTQFVEYVGQKRQLRPEFLRSQVGALIYDEQQALEFGLIDQTANWHEAVRALADMAGLSAGSYQVVRVSNASSWVDALLGARFSAPVKQSLAVCPWGASALVYYGDVAGVCRSLSALQTR